MSCRVAGAPYLTISPCFVPPQKPAVGIKTLSGRSVAADPLQSAQGWSDFAAGFAVGGLSGVAWGYICTQVRLPAFLRKCLASCCVSGTRHSPMSFMCCQTCRRYQIAAEARFDSAALSFHWVQILPYYS